ncbi:MAG: YdcF family protein, partial [Pseudomonadota bacterium]
MGVTRWLRRLAFAAAVLFAVTAAAVVYQAYEMRAEFGRGEALDPPVDVAIILGSGVEADGFLGYGSRRRVRMGVWLLQQGKANTLIMSGGPVREGYPPIGGSMRDFAISLGARPEQVLVEGRARTTLENLRFSMPMAREAGAERIAVVTDHYHLTRAMMLAEYLGYDGLKPAAAHGTFKTLRVLRVYNMTRETMA